MQPVLQHQKHLTNMESLQLVRMAAKVDHGQIRFMSSKVTTVSSMCFNLYVDLTTIVNNSYYKA